MGWVLLERGNTAKTIQLTNVPSSLSFVEVPLIFPDGAAQARTKNARITRTAS